MPIQRYESAEPDAADLVRRALSGDRHAALRILELFALAVRGGRRPRAEYQRFVADGIWRILEAEDGKPKGFADLVAAALCIQKTAHRETDRYGALRDEVLALAIAERLKPEEGLPKPRLEHAKSDVAEEYGVSFGVVDHAWRKSKKGARRKK